MPPVRLTGGLSGLPGVQWGVAVTAAAFCGAITEPEHDDAATWLGRHLGHLVCGRRR